IKLDASEVRSKRSDRAERGGQDVTVAGPCTVPKCSGLTARRSPPSPSRKSPPVCHLAPRLQQNRKQCCSWSILDEIFVDSLSSCNFVENIFRDRL
ncbi:unnamed protein product, partial [Heterotrigona itama]